MRLLATGGVGARRATTHRPILAPLAPPALLALLTLGLLLAGALIANPGVDLSAADPAARRVLVRFHGLERNATDAYRWSEPLAALVLFGFDGRPAIVSLRLAAPRPPGAAPVVVQVRRDNQFSGVFAAAGDWRRYHVLTPTGPIGESALVLQTSPFTPPGDPRELGLALSHVRATAATAGPWLPPARALYLLALPLIGWLLLTRLGTPAPLALGCGALLAMLAGWAMAFPTAAGYWLPTLGWPWWPALPLALLATWPWLGSGLAATRARLARRPAIGWIGLGAALVALGLMRLGLPPFPGMAMFVVGVWVGLPSPAQRDATLAGQRLTARWPLALALIVLLAIGLRFVNLDAQPAGLWRDESRHGLQALRIWNDPGYRPIYVVVGADLPALLFYLMAPAVGLFGPHAWSARLVSALAGALTPLALFWAASPLIGRRAALFAAALVAWSSWSLSMSRWAFPATLDHLLVLAAIGFLWRGLAPPEEAPGTARRVAFLAAAGVLGGLAVYTYHTGRVAPLALAAVAAIRLGASAIAWRRALPGLAVAAVAGALTIAPLALYILNDQQGYNRRVGRVSILDSANLTTRAPAGLILGNLERYLLMFHVRGDFNGRHHMPDAPMLDPVAGWSLAVGLGLALPLLRRRTGVAAVLALGMIYLIPGVFSGNAPHAMRSLGTLAPAAMLAGLGLAALAPPGRAAVWAVALLASLSFNAWLYFGVMRLEPRVYNAFDMVETAMGRLAAAPAASADAEVRAVRVLLPEALLGADTVRFLTWGAPPEAYTGAPIPGDGPVLVLLPGDASAADQAATLAALGPEGLPLGPVATYPDGARPLVLAFARGEAAVRLARGGP
ncbi:MAG: glycosyltransferase family 39 protein [Oscillochloridaceae bacterium]|nr:glycosyltransferase family 39 protein [Chloroflexaceae bacterium]MDW8390895.1 glycosyltransferase family 39 protein [Oscillochloridaceae bacterium]